MAELQQHLANLNDNYIKIKGSLSPDAFYKKVINGKNQPDLVAISILSEIVYWYRPQKNSNSPKFFEDAWRTSYKHFTEKFGFCREKTRRALVRLEQMNLVQREYRTVTKYGHEYNNILYIHLKIDNINKILEGQIIDKKICQTNLHYQAPSPQNEGDIYRNKDYKKNLLSRSEFEKNISEKSESAITIQSISQLASKDFKAFLPLSEDLYSKIKTKSIKSYSSRFINQLLTKLASKYESYRFYNEDAFINYIVKALDNEMIKEKIANLDNFKLDSNYHQNNEIFKFLSDIESSNRRDLNALLKKKIAAIFDTNIAYYILQSYRFPDRVHNGRYIIEKIRTYDTKEDILTNSRKDRMFKEIEFLFEVESSAIDIIDSKKLYKTESNEYFVNECDWGKVRLKLHKKYGEGVDKSWFSKLDMKKSVNSLVAEIIAPSLFIRDYIKTNYYFVIREAIQEIFPEIQNVEVINT